jgi:hypothetical protein
MFIWLTSLLDDVIQKLKVHVPLYSELIKKESTLGNSPCLMKTLKIELEVQLSRVSDEASQSDEQPTA